MATTANEDHVLCEREAGGVSVALSRLPLASLCVLTVAHDGEQAAITIEPERAFDAFQHPFVYLSERQIEKLHVS